MRSKMCVALSLLVFVCLMVFGLIAKSNYIDINDEENPMDKFVVGLIPDSILDIQLEHLENNLPESNIIIAVRCMEKSTFRFSCTTQKVEVVKVFKGDVSIGEIIDVARNGSCIFFDKENYVNGLPAINLNFVNEMKPNEMYLVFLDRKIQTYNDENIYIQSMDFLISPIFCYSEIHNEVCVSETNLSDSAAYKNVKNNEFFLMSETAIDNMEKLKKSLLQKYPI